MKNANVKSGLYMYESQKLTVEAKYKWKKVRASHIQLSIMKKSKQNMANKMCSVQNEAAYEAAYGCSFFVRN